MYTTCVLAITKSSLLFKRKNWQTSDEMYYYKGLRYLKLVLSQYRKIKIQFWMKQILWDMIKPAHSTAYFTFPFVSARNPVAIINKLPDAGMNSLSQ